MLSLLPLIAQSPKPLLTENLVFIQENTLVRNISHLTEKHHQQRVLATRNDFRELVGENTLMERNFNLTAEEVKLLDKLWFCESSRRHTGIWGDKGKSYGAFQFQQPTWDLFCEGLRENFDDQVRCVKKMIDMGLGGKTIGWYNCWRKMGLDKYFQ